MMPTVRRLDLRADPDADLTEVAEWIRGGGVVAYPTETVYGLGGACTPEGVRLVQAHKPRNGKPMIALVESVESVEALAWTPSARALAEIFWPGSVTLVLADPAGIFPPGVRHPTTDTVAVRVTPHPVASRLVTTLGAPLTSTSLNAPGDVPVTSGHDALDLVERIGGTGVWVLDGGTLPQSEPSTIVDCTGAEPTVLREGAVPLERLRCAIPEVHGHRSD